MKFVSELIGRYPGADIYVVGTGSSLRVFPTDFFNGKITIGLNMAWKSLPVEFCVTIHPDINIPEIMGEAGVAFSRIKWIVGHPKAQKLLSSDQFSRLEKSAYFFTYRGKENTQPPHEPSDSGRILDWVRQPSGDNLYVWSSISQAGVNLAANMGAKNIILVGCDNGPLLDNHHSHSQHTRWKGVDPFHRYRQYYEGLAEIRSVLRGRSINVVSMSPFLSVLEIEEDFRRLCRELDKPELVENHDISLDQNKAFAQMKLRKFSTRIKSNLRRWFSKPSRSL